MLPTSLPIDTTSVPSKGSRKPFWWWPMFYYHSLLSSLSFVLISDHELLLGARENLALELQVDYQFLYVILGPRRGTCATEQWLVLWTWSDSGTMVKPFLSWSTVSLTPALARGRRRRTTIIMAVDAIMPKQALVLTTWLTQPECPALRLCTFMKIAAKSLFVFTKPFQLSDGLHWATLMIGSCVQEVFEMLGCVCFCWKCKNASMNSLQQRHR